MHRPYFIIPILNTHSFIHSFKNYLVRELSDSKNSAKHRRFNRHKERNGPCLHWAEFSQVDTVHCSSSHPLLIANIPLFQPPQHPSNHQSGFCIINT